MKRTDHPSEQLLQEHADGVLAAAELAGVEAHLAACARCRAELEAWRLVFAELAELPRLAPSAGFAERVMARVVVPLPLRVRVLARLRRWLDTLFPLPATPRTWATAAAAAAVPLTAVTGLGYWVLSYPRVTPGTLAAYLVWRVRDAAVALLGRMSAGLLDSELAYRAYAILEPLVQSPGAALLAAASFSALTVLALWVLYRNLFTARTVDGKYALLFSI